MTGLDEREPRHVALHERLAREQQLDVHLEKSQLERGDVLVADHDAVAIDCELERGLARREIDLLLIATLRIDDRGIGTVELVEHRHERLELAAPAIDGQFAPSRGQRARAWQLADDARGIRGEVIVLQALCDPVDRNARQRREGRLDPILRE